MNDQLAQQVLQALASLTVREICVCAGARSAPLVLLLERCENVKVYSFFEERSASFFALGRMLQSGLPVAVITTSGTAAAELLPAAIESTYQNLPLIMVTADRPRNFRGSGAPQSIEQVGLFSHYVELALDISADDQDWSLNQWQGQGPLD